MTKLFSSGLIPVKSGGYEAYCGLSDKGTTQIKQCSSPQYLNGDKLKADFDANCQGHN